MNMLITAGPTREAIDPVRFISNRSSGKMGYAVAAAGVAAGHSVVLVSGPVALTPPAGLAVVNVNTADEMLRAVRERVEWCEVLVMVAAVADWRPARVSPLKIKKDAMPASLPLERTPDILKEIRPLKKGRFFVGFAAETGAVAAEAARKQREKGLDLVVANDVSSPGAGFEVDTNRVTLLHSDGRLDEWPLMSKLEIATRLIDTITRRCAARR